MTDDGPQDYKTLRVPDDAWERAREQKEAAGRTWGEQIVRPEGGGEDGETLSPEEFEQWVRELHELVERVPERTAEELEGRVR